VAFLGDVAEDRVDRAGTAIHEVAARTPPMRLHLAGGSTFGGRQNPILWVGLAGDTAALRLLGAATQRALRRARFRIDDRPLRPHLTLSRPGSRVPLEDVAADVATLAEYEGPQWTVEELSLMRSEMLQTPTGPTPHYTVLATAPLAA
jgi:2'-5' RNA ligase